MKSDEFFLSATALSELLETVLCQKASLRFQVKGFSMSPFIKNDDVITVSPLFNSSIDIGKIVAFIHPKSEKLVIHRVVGKSINYYLLKGDTAFGMDGLISRENILGTVTKVERKGKEIILGLDFGRYLIVLLSRYKILFLLMRIWRTIPVSLRKPVL